MTEIMYWRCKCNGPESVVVPKSEYDALLAWQRRACNVLPMVPREVGSDLADEISWLLHNEEAS